jgi:hypothetical protein
MDKPAEKRKPAWQPLTPRGVAAFATASFGRLWLVQLIVAGFAGLCVIWFLNRAWLPVVAEAIQQLPGESEIRRGKLNWAGSSPEVLAENRFLAVAIDLKHEGQARSPAHVQVELGERTVKIISILGFVERSYPVGWRVGLSRTEAEPWWGAWRPASLAVSGGATAVALMAIWGILGLFYSAPAWLLAFFANRQGKWVGQWRLAQAALLPGALVLSLGIVLYGLGALDLLRLFVAAGAHMLIGWVYVVAAIFRLPIQKGEGAFGAKENPFATVSPSEELPKD